MSTLLEKFPYKLSEKKKRISRIFSLLGLTSTYPQSSDPSWVVVVMANPPRNRDRKKKTEATRKTEDTGDFSISKGERNEILLPNSQSETKSVEMRVLVHGK